MTDLPAKPPPAVGGARFVRQPLLCHDHHTAVHHHGWTVRLEEDGLPTLHPPPWIDPTRTPRRHHRYQLRQLGYHLDGHDPPD